MPNYDEIIENLCQQGFSIIPDFLPFGDYQAIASGLNELQNNQSLQAAGIGRGNAHQQNKVIRNDFIHWIDEQESTPSEQTYLHAMYSLAAELNKNLFTGLKSYECHYAVYSPGSFYKKHVDQFQGTQDRQISCVYYLNADWQPDDKGQLRLYNLQDEFLIDVPPLGNSLICFRSNLPHEVLTTQKTRTSIAGWFKIS